MTLLQARELRSAQRRRGISGTFYFDRGACLVLAKLYYTRLFRRTESSEGLPMERRCADRRDPLWADG